MENSLETEIPLTLEEIRRMPNDQFQARYSGDSIPPSHFSDKVGYFCTNEYDYPDSLYKINVHGGIHLAVMGGVDPVLGQIVTANPELTIMCEVNTESLKTTVDGRIKLIPKSGSGTEYWNKVTDFFRNVVKKIDPKRQDFPSDLDVISGGWSSQDKFSVAKEAVVNGKVKWIAGDIATDGVKVAFELAKQTMIPVKLIYVSNIFDYKENSREKFNVKLAKGIKDGLIDPNAQVIDTSLGEGISTQVIDIATYLQLTSK